MTPAQIKQNIALLKKEGMNRVIYDCLWGYLEITRGPVPKDLSQIALRIADKLINKYKEQLPKKAVKVRQKTLQDEIDEVRRDKPFWDKLDRAYGRD